MNVQTLVSSYGNCLYPTIKIKVHHKNIDKRCDQLHISCSMQRTGDALISYEFEDESELSKMKTACKLGSTLEVLMGYDESVETIFLGYLHTVEVQQKSSELRIELYAQDVFGLMMNHQNLSHYKTKSAQKILEELVKQSPYTTFIKHTNISKSKDEEETFTQWQESDFATMESICERKGMHHYMRCDTLIIEPIGTAFTPELSFTTYGIEEITHRISAANLLGKVQVYGRDQEKKTILKEKHVPLSQIACIPSVFANLTLIDRYDMTKTMEELHQRCEVLIKQVCDCVEVVEFTSLYIPELVLGRKLNFKGIESIGVCAILQELEITYEHQTLTAHGIAAVIK